MLISRKGVPDGVRGGAAVKKIALMKVRDMGKGEERWGWSRGRSPFQEQQRAELEGFPGLL